VDDIVAHPYAVKSDSFYFVGEKLVMHNKAEYKYYDPPESERIYKEQDAGDEGKYATKQGEGKSDGGGGGADGKFADDSDDEGPVRTGK